MNCREQLIEKAARAIRAVDGPCTIGGHDAAVAVVDALMPQVSTVEELEAEVKRLRAQVASLTQEPSPQPDPACVRCDSRLKKCWRCGHRGPWLILRDCDHLAATCGHCRAEFDIGWSARGFDPDLIPGDEVQPK